MSSESIPLHPLCAAFPRMAGDEFADLVTSIKQNGQREPVVVLNGAVLDGQNRVLACQHVGVEPSTIEYDGDVSEAALRAFVCDRNLTRRHLEAGQRAMIAADLASWRLGENQHTAEGELANSPTSLAEAARLMNVGRDTAVRAKRLKAVGDQELVDAVREGRKTLNAALNEAAPKPAAPVEPRAAKPAPTEPRLEPSVQSESDRVAELSKQVLDLRKENERLLAKLVKATTDVEAQVKKRVDAYIAENLDADARKALKAAKSIRHTAYPLTHSEFRLLQQGLHPDTAAQKSVLALDLLGKRKPLLVSPELPVGATPRLPTPPMPDNLEAAFAAAEAKRKEDARLRKDAKRVKLGVA
jgi:hypothetical protein